MIESSTKNLLKLYLNDVGILTGVLYGSNISAVLNDVPSINLGAVYETVVAQELKAHGKKLFYYDNRHKGEVDFLIDDFDSLSVVPIEVKSGRDYRIHSAIDNLLKTNENAKGCGFVFADILCDVPLKWLFPKWKQPLLMETMALSWHVDGASIKLFLKNA